MKKKFIITNILLFLILIIISNIAGLNEKLEVGVEVIEEENLEKEKTVEIEQKPEKQDLETGLMTFGPDIRTIVIILSAIIFIWLYFYINTHPTLATICPNECKLSAINHFLR